MIIIFDLDGTLLDSNRVKFEVIRKFISEYFGENTFNKHYSITKSRMSLLEDLLPFEKKQRLLLHSKLSKQLDEEVINAPVFKDVKKILSSLKKRSEKLYISSNTPQTSLQRILKEKDLIKFFDGYYGSPLTKFDIVKSIVERNPECEITVVGDGVDDLESALTINAKYIAVNNPRTDKKKYPPIEIGKILSVLNYD